MRYLWEVVLEAYREDIPLKSLHFFHDRKGSAYTELSLPCINQEELYGRKEIGVNTYFRFYRIFKGLFTPEQEEFQAVRDSLTDVMLHVLAENDSKRGMTKEEYYKKLLAVDMKTGVNGESAKTVFAMLSKEEREILLSGWLRCYQVGSSLAIFIDMIHNLVKKSIVYHNNDCPDEILIYTGQEKEEQIEQRIQCLQELFLDIHYHVEVYYGYHFGIIGVDDTMKIDEITIY